MSKRPRLGVLASFSERHELSLSFLSLPSTCSLWLLENTEVEIILVAVQLTRGRTSPLATSSRSHLCSWYPLFVPIGRSRSSATTEFQHTPQAESGLQPLWSCCCFEIALYRELAGLLTEVGRAFILYGKRAEAGGYENNSCEEEIGERWTDASCLILGVNQMRHSCYCSAGLITFQHKLSP